MSGDLATKKATVLRDGVECPSISPDGTRIAFKQRTSDGGADLPTWQPAVLDLSTLKDHPLAETRTVDDQIEWLDNSTVAYAVDTGIGAPSIYAAAADGTGAPASLSPTPTRPPSPARPPPPGPAFVCRDERNRNANSDGAAITGHPERFFFSERGNWVVIPAV